MKTNCRPLAIIYVFIHIFLVKAYEKRIQQRGEYSKEYNVEPDWEEYEDYVEDDAQDCREKDLPVILWWTPFTGVFGLPRFCTFGDCCLTQDRNQIHRPNTKVVLFYGTDFDPTDLPLPRKKDVWWGLLHEESPKNKPILNHPPVVHQFNITATFKRESDFPLTLQFLPSMEFLTSTINFITTQKKNEFLDYFTSGKSEELKDAKSKVIESTDGNDTYIEEILLKTKNETQEGTEEVLDDESFRKIAPIAYIHSDCDTPSERDDYVKELAKYIKIDSLGECLNSKVLPPHVADASHFSHPEFLHLLARYKFTLTIENYGCDDYITEKFWRPLIVGSVPVYWGSPTIADWAPNNKSVIRILDFSTPKDLAHYLHTLLRNDSLYEAHLTHKINGEVTNTRLTTAMNEREWALDDIEKGSFLDHFECFVCDQIYRFHPHLTCRTSYQTRVANTSQCRCPEPKTVLTNSANKRSDWLEEYEKSKIEAEVLGDFLKHNKPFSEDDYYERVFESLKSSGFFRRFPPKHHDEL